MSGAVERIRRAVAEALAPHARTVLAVSGGPDSMVLLDAAAHAAREQVSLVATFDHASGPHSGAAAELVERVAESLRLPVLVGRAQVPDPGAGETEWRRARWRFLRHSAAELGARVVTAHTRDDQVETVLMRAMRGAGPRGLAAMFADSPVVRPLLATSRADVERYVGERGLETVRDPGNLSRAHLRNRIRLELIPALERACPRFGDDLLEIARRSAEWRQSVERAAESIEAHEEEMGALHVALRSVTGYSPTALAMLWPALAARAGATLDRRGTSRLVEFTTHGRSGQSIQLAGGFEIVRRRDVLIVRRARDSRTAVPGDAAQPLHGSVRLGTWRLRPAGAIGKDSWSAVLPAGRALSVRAWRPGDRMRGEGRAAARRVKRWLADAHVPADRRAGWPVVLADDEIVWIPGVRRGHAATDRSGRPGLSYVCERNDHG
jgi:tRNA(Ile)-lysidine synthase